MNVPKINLRYLILTLGLCAMAAPALAETPDLATIARSSGAPEIPGLKMVWLAPWGDLAKAHPWRNIIVHRTEGPAGSARDAAGWVAALVIPIRASSCGVNWRVGTV